MKAGIKFRKVINAQTKISAKVAGEILTDI